MWILLRKLREKWNENTKMRMDNGILEIRWRFPPQRNENTVGLFCWLEMSVRCVWPRGRHHARSHCAIDVYLQKCQKQRTFSFRIMKSLARLRSIYLTLEQIVVSNGFENGIRIGIRQRDNNQGMMASGFLSLSHSMFLSLFLRFLSFHSILSAPVRLLRVSISHPTSPTAINWIKLNCPPAFFFLLHWTMPKQCSYEPSSDINNDEWIYQFSLLFCSVIIFSLCSQPYGCRCRTPPPPLPPKRTRRENVYLCSPARTNHRALFVHYIRSSAVW